MKSYKSLLKIFIFLFILLGTAKVSLASDININPVVDIDGQILSMPSCGVISDSQMHLQTGIYPASGTGLGHVGSSADCAQYTTANISFYLTQVGGTGDYSAYFNTATDVYYFTWHMSPCSSNIYGECIDSLNSISFADTTRFISTQPTYGTTTASTTVYVASTFQIANDPDTDNCSIFVFNSDGNGTPDCDFKMNVVLRNLDNTNLPQVYYNFGKVTSSDFATSTILLLERGFYTGQWSIVYGNKIITATSTRFIVISTNLSSSTVDEYLNGTSSPIASESECKGLAFLSFACFRSMFIMTEAQKQDLYDTLTVQIFGKVPFAYVVRVNTIINGSTTQSLPTLSYTFPTTTPLASTLGGTNIHFNPWLYGYNATDSPLRTIKSPQGKDVWQIMQGVFSTIVYLVLIFKIINDLLKIHVHDKQQL
jgi:hypothetical protein